MRFPTVFLFAITSLLVACSSSPRSKTQSELNKQSLAFYTSAPRFAKLTNAQRLSEDEFLITVEGPVFMSAEKVDRYLVARAAFEADFAEAPSFVFTRVSYDSKFWPEFGSTIEVAPQASWIGDFKSLAEERTNQDLLGDYSGFGRKTVSAYMKIFSDKTSEMRRTAFDVDSIQTHLVPTLNK